MLRAMTGSLFRKRVRRLLILELALATRTVYRVVNGASGKPTSPSLRLRSGQALPRQGKNPRQGRSTRRSSCWFPAKECARLAPPPRSTIGIARPRNYGRVPLAELVLVIFGFILLWRQRNIRQEFAELEKRHAARSDALRRELLELRRKIDETPAEPAASSGIPSPPVPPTPEAPHPAQVRRTANLPPAAVPVTIPPAPIIP